MCFATKRPKNSAINKAIEQKSKKQKNKANKGINQVKPNKQAELADDELCFTVWNIFVLKQSKINKIKNKTNKFLNDMFKTSDFVVSTETWEEPSDSDLFDLDDEFEEKNKRIWKKKFKKGIDCQEVYHFAQEKKLERDYEILSSDFYRIWLKINKSLYNGNIIICFLYIPPSQSNWFKSGKSFNFDKLKQELAFYERQDSAIFIIGDNNARVVLENDFIVNDEIDEFMTLPEDYIPEIINMKKTIQYRHQVKTQKKNK